MKSMKLVATLLTVNVIAAFAATAGVGICATSARDSAALVWIGSRTGPAFIGKAEIVQDKALQDLVGEQYPKKYLLARVGFARPSRAKLDSGQIVVIRISPARDLPGLTSEPGTRAPGLEEQPEPKKK